MVYGDSGWWTVVVGVVVDVVVDVMVVVVLSRGISSIYYSFFNPQA